MKRFGFVMTLGTTAIALFAAGCSQTSQPIAPESTASSAPLEKIRKVPAGQAVVPGSYIVVFKESVGDAASTVRQLAGVDGVQAENVYQHAIKGFSAELTPAQLQKLANDPRVDFIEPNMIVSAYVQTLPWGVDNVDADLSTTVAGNGSGAVAGVRVYVIDTGIDLDHPDLNVVMGVDFVSKRGGNGDDNNGHGTHVAGTIAAKDNDYQVVGVAPGAQLYAVKVLDARGSGTTSNIIKGIDWVTSQKTANPTVPMVANMSLGGYTGTASYSAMDNAVLRSINAGVFYSIAAGNSSANASFYSPAHVTQAVTVGAYNISNVWATSFSNYGAVVDINGPGVNILSTYRNGGTSVLSGTSMAAPHVAGAAALYLSNNPGAAPQVVADAIVQSATSNPTSRVTSVPSGTTPLAVYTGGF